MPSRPFFRRLTGDGRVIACAAKRSRALPQAASEFRGTHDGYLHQAVAALDATEGSSHYHFGMAMTLRLPDDLDRAARALAEREHRSLHGFIVNAVDEYIRRHGMDLVVDQIGANLAERYSEALDRLGKS